MYAYCACYKYTATGYADDMECSGMRFGYFLADSFGQAMNTALDCFKAYGKFETAPGMNYQGLHYHLNEVTLDRVKL